MAASSMGPHSLLLTQDGHYLSRPSGSVNVTLARILYEMSAEI